MQHLNTLWQVVNTASQLAELARSAQIYRFAVQDAITFYLHTASATVRIARWHERAVEVNAQLQAPVGWRIASDQDDAGVYFVAQRRAMLSSIAAATFNIHVPYNAHLVLKLDHVNLSFETVSATLELPPVAANQPPVDSETLNGV